MKLGMPVLYEYNSIKENIELAKKLNLDFIELNLNFPYCMEEFSKNRKLNKLIKESNLQVTLHFYDEADFASYKEVVDAYIILLKKYLKLTKDLNIKLLNVHLNIGPIVTIAGEKHYIYEKEYNTYIKRLITNLKLVQNLCNKYGILLVLENVYTPEFMCNTYVDLINEGFNFNWDIGHDNNYYDNVKKIYESNDKMKLKEMHIHDGNRKTCHLALGNGNINVGYFKGIADKNDCYVVLEVKSSEDLITSVPKFNELEISEDANPTLMSDTAYEKMIREIRVNEKQEAKKIEDEKLRAKKKYKAKKKALKEKAKNKKDNKTLDNQDVNQEDVNQIDEENVNESEGE